MPFQMKVQPIDERAAARIDPAKPTPKSRLKRLFEWQFPGVMRISVAEKPGDGRERTDDGVEVEPSSVCLDKMVVSFMEDGGNERPPRGRCYCFNGNYEDISDDETDIRGGGDHLADAAELIKVDFFFFLNTINHFSKKKKRVAIFDLLIDFDFSS